MQVGLEPIRLIRASMVLYPNPAVFALVYANTLAPKQIAASQAGWLRDVAGITVDEPQAGDMTCVVVRVEG